MPRLKVLCLGVAFCAHAFMSEPMNAATINVGLVSFDTFIPPAPGAPGVDVFSINDFSGDPNTGGFALPPDFPVLSSLTFRNSVLSLVSGGSTQVISLGNFGPGSFTPASLKLADTTKFSSAVFSATLSQTSFLLSNGTTFKATSASIRANLLPSSGPSLNPGDFALIAVSDAPVSAPEPGTFVLTTTAPLALYILRKRKQWGMKP